MFGLRLFAVLLVLFALVSSVFVVGIEALDVEDGAVSAVEDAEEAVAEAFGAVLEAEEVGANVSGLLDRLDVAAEYLAVARVCLRVENFDGAVSNASLCVGALEGIVRDARVLRDRVANESDERSWMAIGGSVVCVVAVVCGCWFGWNWFKKWYYRRVLEMRPEVVEG